jgi:hypothetical protein
MDFAEAEIWIRNGLSPSHRGSLNRTALRELASHPYGPIYS